ncbi:MAG TPA: Fe(3+) ABC transporter substrate-binding protein [Crinalium sp.]
MTFSRRGFLATLAGLTMLVVVGCETPEPTAQSGNNATSRATSQEVNVYSSRHYESDDALYKGFTERTGIRVNLIEGKDDELIERIKSEGQNSPADVLITVDAGRLWRAEQENLFQPVTSDTLMNAVPENLRHPENHWFGLTRRARVIVYDKNKVNPSDLSTYEALAEPQWKGRVCIRSSSNIYNQSLLGSMIESKGASAAESWAKALVGNLAREPEGGDTDQIKAVAAGQCDVAIVNHYYWARLAKSDKPEEQAIANQIGVFFPNQNDRGTHVNISGAGVIATAPHKESAIAFLEYLVSPEAQKVFAEGSLEYPIASGVPVDPVLADLGEFKTDTVNVNAYGENNPEAVQIADRAGWK